MSELSHRDAPVMPRRFVCRLALDFEISHHGFCQMQDAHKLLLLTEPSGPSRFSTARVQQARGEYIRNRTVAPNSTKKSGAPPRANGAPGQPKDAQLRCYTDQSYMALNKANPVAIENKIGVKTIIDRTNSECSVRSLMWIAR